MDGARVGSRSLVTGKGIGLRRQTVSVPAEPPPVGFIRGLTSAAAAALLSDFEHKRPHSADQLSLEELSVAVAAQRQRVESNTADSTLRRFCEFGRR